MEEEGLQAPNGADAEERLRRIMARVCLRDPAALARLYDATVSRTFALAARMVKDPHMAEEVVSDVYLQVWRTASTYESARGAVSTWILMICRSRALDVLRSRSGPVVYQGVVEDVPSDGADDPLDLLAATERSSSVHAALSALAPLPRQLIALAFFRGYTHQEIATFTGIPLGSVKSLIRRALTNLRAATHEHEEPDA